MRKIAAARNKKPWKGLDSIVILKIFSSETVNSYQINREWVYVCQYNAGHFIHYRFQYRQKFVSLTYWISQSMYR